MTFPSSINKSRFILKYLCELFFLGFIVIPGIGQWINGIPLGSLHELIAIAVLIAICAALPNNSTSNEIKNSKQYTLIACALIACIGIKITAATFAPSHGIKSAYQVIEIKGDGTQATPSETTTDVEIHFNNSGYSLTAYPFPLWFLNDKDHFIGNSGEIDKSTIPFTATWKTNLYIPPTHPSITLTANENAQISVVLNGVTIPIPSVPAIIPLPPGINGTVPLEIRYDSGATTNRLISLAWANDTKQIITEKYFYVAPATTEQIKKDGIWRMINNIAIITVFLLFILYIVIKTRKAAWLAWMRSDSFIFLTLFLGGLAFSTHNLLAMADSRYFNLLPAGNDPILYETFARHIAATGDWAMTVYEKDSYYWQILYYYLLAITHLIVGEGIFPLFFIQSIGLMGAALLTVKIGRNITKGRNPLVYVAGIGVFFHPLTQQYVTQLYPIGMFLSVATIAILLMAEKKPTGPTQWIFFGIGGICAGLLILMRSNMEPFIPVILIWMAISLKRKSFIPIIIFMTFYCLILTPFIVRNSIVKGKAELYLRSSGTSSLLLGTPVPETFVPTKPPSPLMSAIAYRFVDGRATRTLQWIEEDPRAYGLFLIQKAKKFFGVDPLDITIFLPFTLFLFGSALYVVAPPCISPAVRRKDYLLVGGFVITQCIVLTVTSVGFARYLIPLLPFTFLMTAFLILGIYNALGRLFNKKNLP